MQLDLFESPRATTPAQSAKHSRERRNKAYAASEPKHGSQNELVLEYLKKRGPSGATRHQIADTTGLPLASVCRVASALVKAGLCYEDKSEHKGRGILRAKGYA